MRLFYINWYQPPPRSYDHSYWQIRRYAVMGSTLRYFYLDLHSANTLREGVQIFPILESCVIRVMSTIDPHWVQTCAYGSYRTWPMPISDETAKQQIALLAEKARLIEMRLL